MRCASPAFIRLFTDLPHIIAFFHVMHLKYYWKLNILLKDDLPGIIHQIMKLKNIQRSYMYEYRVNELLDKYGLSFYKNADKLPTDQAKWYNRIEKIIYKFWKNVDIVEYQKFQSNHDLLQHYRISDLTVFAKKKVLPLNKNFAAKFINGWKWYMRIITNGYPQFYQLLQCPHCDQFVPHLLNHWFGGNCDNVFVRKKIRDFHISNHVGKEFSGNCLNVVRFLNVVCVKMTWQKPDPNHYQKN